MSQNQSMESSKEEECKAIDSSGCLGSFYKKQQDRLLKGRLDNVRRQVFMVSKSLCKVTKGSMDASFNLLQFIGIQDELRLHLLLNATNRNGIAAVINYPRRINEYTRMLYYSYIDRQERVDNIQEVSHLLKSSDPQRYASHIITVINFGIDLVAVLQLPSDPDITIRIDNILKKIRDIFLNDDNNISILTPEENHFLEKHIKITVYSNTPTFTSLHHITDILAYVHKIKKNHGFCHPVIYYLRSTHQLHPQYKGTMRTVSLTLIQKIEQCLLQLRIPVKYLEASLKDHMPHELYGNLQDRLHKAEQQFSLLKDKYVKTVDKFFQITTEFYSGRCDTSSIQSALNDNALSTLKATITQLTEETTYLERQKQLIIQARQQQLIGSSLSERYSYDHNSARTTGIVLERDDQRDEINHLLNNNNDSQRKGSGQLSFNEQENNSNLSPASASYLYPSVRSENIISPSDNINNGKNQSKQKTLSTTDVPQIPDQSIPSPPTNAQIINVLLLGETGVGKSTFINAFVNYLSFDTFEQAESNKPVVLIPVSFLMTVGDNFKERTVKFGDIDDSKNEDFDHPGQSVTQHCKSYLFHLDDGTKLCIIDTPGFGDTRGLSQDDRNMQHVLEYINNLSHLNAICFLLKPNTSRMNIFFRSCLTQLFDLLGPNICPHLTFCFTNARATFYTPGDTAPLLRNILNSLPINDIPFKKENTFCFDNESFRYLGALRNEISFNAEATEEYRMSWSTSVKESNRLINYIRKTLVPYTMQGNWQSIKHAQFEIIHMVRPILEAIRNSLRNILLRNKQSSNESIELCPIVLHRSASLCLLCQQERIQINNFWIIEDCPHEFQNKCLICSCSADHHIPIDYILGYKSMNSSSNYLQNDMNDMLDQLCHATAMFAYFLIYIARSPEKDLFRNGLERMVFQENDLCNHQKPDNLNSQLVKELMKRREDYERNISRMKSKEEHITLPVLYDLMNTISKYPIIQMQLAAIRQGQKIIMKQHENEYQEI